MPDEQYLSAEDFLGKQTLTPTEEKEILSAAKEGGINIIFNKIAVKVTSGRFAGLIDQTERATFPVLFLEDFYQKRETDTGEIYRPSTSYLEQGINQIAGNLKSTGILQFTFTVDENNGNLLISNERSTWTLRAD